MPKLIFMSLLSWPNWNLPDASFCGGRKTGKPGENPRSKARTNNKLSQPTFITRPESNPGHIGGR